MRTQFALNWHRLRREEKKESFFCAPQHLNFASLAARESFCVISGRGSAREREEKKRKSFLSLCSKTFSDHWRPRGRREQVNPVTHIVMVCPLPSTYGFSLCSFLFPRRFCMHAVLFVSEWWTLFSLTPICFSVSPRTVANLSIWHALSLFFIPPPALNARNFFPTPSSLFCISP